MSRGFIFLATLAFVIGIIACFFENQKTHRKVSITFTALKVVALLALLTLTLVAIPQGINHNIFEGDFDKINFAMGVDHSASTAFFYIGVLAFVEGVFPLKITAIASSHNRSSLPLGLATVSGMVTRWIFCFLTSVILMNKNYIAPGALNFALIGVVVYITLAVLPEIIDDQVYVQQLMFYRGNMDLPVSFIVAFVTPWAIASLVHYVDTLLSLVCFFAFTVGIFVSYVNPFVFFMETVRESSYFETNFRLSLKQMYDGDRLSKKETSILPKTVKLLENAGRSSLAPDFSQNAHSTTANSQFLLQGRATDDAILANIPGSIKQSQYPTTQLLKRSSLKNPDFMSDQASIDSSLSGLEENGDGAASDYSELNVASEQAMNPIMSDKLIRAYNE